MVNFYQNFFKFSRYIHWDVRYQNILTQSIKILTYGWNWAEPSQIIIRVTAVPPGVVLPDLGLALDFGRLTDRDCAYSTVQETNLQNLNELYHADMVVWKKWKRLVSCLIHFKWLKIMKYVPQIIIFFMTILTLF